MACYYMPSNSKAGVGYQAHALATALTRRGHEVTVFTSSPSVDGAAYRTTTVPLQGAMRSLRFAMWLRRADWSAYDVLHAHAGDYLLFPGRVAAHIRTVHGSSLREARHISGLRSKAAMTFYWLCEMLATVVADESVAVSANTSSASVAVSSRTRSRAKSSLAFRTRSSGWSRTTRRSDEA
jgi:hypothetical protein